MKLATSHQHPAKSWATASMTTARLRRYISNASLRSTTSASMPHTSASISQLKRSIRDKSPKNGGLCEVGDFALLYRNDSLKRRGRTSVCTNLIPNAAFMLGLTGDGIPRI